MTRIVVALVVVMAISGRSWGAEGRLYSCEIKDVMSLGDNGIMTRTDWDKASHEKWKTFTFDEMTGIFRYGNSDVSRKMVVVQKGSTENSAIGLFTYRGAASAGADVLRIATFTKGMPFMFVDTDQLYTGSCKKL